MIDARNNASLLQLPLDKLLQQAAAGARHAAGRSGRRARCDRAAAPPAARVDVRSRDNQRGRDRDSR